MSLPYSMIETTHVSNSFLNEVHPLHIIIFTCNTSQSPAACSREGVHSVTEIQSLI